MSLLQPARYFPIDGTPLKMAPGLYPLGTDFGNGARDKLFFQIDAEKVDYLRQKGAVSPSRFELLKDTPAQLEAQHKALDWIRGTFANEYPKLEQPDRSTSLAQQWTVVREQVQCDIAVLSAPPNDQIITTQIAFPSGWAPERILGASFWNVHGPVPTFANSRQVSRNLARAMCMKGPFVRFVWTVCGDRLLDHHPMTPRPKWDGRSPGWLRVERQVTVPLVTCSVFLIRTYLYPLASLTDGQRSLLSRSLLAMPESFARYKGLANIIEPVCNQLSVLGT